MKQILQLKLNIKIVHRVSGPGRPPKLKVSCTWCNDTKQALKYVLPIQNGKKEFCSDECLGEYRKASMRGACIQCDNVIRSTPIRVQQADGPPKDFCSSFCATRYQKRENQQEKLDAKLVKQGKLFALNLRYFSAAFFLFNVRCSFQNQNIKTRKSPRALKKYFSFINCYFFFFFLMI